MGSWLEMVHYRYSRLILGLNSIKSGSVAYSEYKTFQGEVFAYIAFFGYIRLAPNN